MLKHDKIQSLLEDVQDWPGKVIKRHNDAELNIHKLTFLADLGIRGNEPQIENVIGKILKNPSVEGPFQILVNMPVYFGGSGRDEYHWILCDTPNIQYALHKFGLEDEAKIEKATEYLIGLVRDNGWPCAASSTLGTGFRGPGKSTDPCPYATLIMLKTLGISKKWKYSEASRYGVESLLNLWQHSYDKSPYLFKMGNDFRKLKAPLIWYDLLHLSEVLSQFEWIYDDPRFLEMINLLSTKADEQNRYKADSIWLAWKDWDFGQKNDPSPWLTFLVLRILRRIGQININKSTHYIEN